MDKQGNVLSGGDQSLFQFFGLNSSTTAITDPSVMFDNTVSNGTGNPSGRFIVAALNGPWNQLHTAVTWNSFDVAVSNDANPSDGFTEMHNWNISENGLYEGDFPRGGWNADAYVYTLNMYSGSTFALTQVISIDKSTVIDKNNGTFTHYSTNILDNSNDVTGEHTLVPATMHGASTNGPMWFVAADNQSNSPSDVSVIKETNVLSSSPTFTVTAVSVNTYYQPTHAPLQPGGTAVVQKIDDRMLSVAWRDNKLVAAQNTGSSDGNYIYARWYQFDTSGSTPSVTYQGTIIPYSTAFTYYPGIDISPSDSLGMSYMQSSSTEDVSVYVTGRLANDSVGNGYTEGGDLAWNSNQIYSPPSSDGVRRAGDFSGIGVDPTDGSFWSANEDVIAQPGGSPPPPPIDNWGTKITNFTVGNTGLGTAPSMSATGTTVWVVNQNNVLFRHDSTVTSTVAKFQPGYYEIGAAIQSVSAVTDKNGLVNAFVVTTGGELAEYNNTNGWSVIASNNVSPWISAGTDSGGLADVFFNTADSTNWHFKEYSTSAGTTPYDFGAVGVSKSNNAISALKNEWFVVVNTAQQLELRQGYGGNWEALGTPGLGTGNFQTVSAIDDGLTYQEVFAVDTGGNLFRWDSYAYSHNNGNGWYGAALASNVSPQIATSTVSSGYGRVFFNASNGNFSSWDPTNGLVTVGGAGATAFAGLPGNQVYITYSDGSIQLWNGNWQYVY